MPSKYRIILEMASQTARDIASNADRYTDFLITAANNYKYSFKEQLLIHAQKPDATACAEIDTWNKLGRWVNKGTKGIALLILFYGFAVLLDLRTVTWVLNNVVTVARWRWSSSSRSCAVHWSAWARPPYGRTGCSATAAPILRCAVCGRALWLPSAMRLNSFPTPAPVP